MCILSLRVKATMALFGWIVGLGGFAADVIISYGDNEEIAVDAGLNVNNNVLFLGAENTLKLTGAPEKNLPCRLLTAPLTADVVWQLGAVTVAGEENARLKIRLDWNAANNTLSATVVPKGVAITIR